MEQSQIDIRETTELKEEYPDADETNIIQTIIKLMEQIEDFVDMSGLEKKVPTCVYITFWFVFGL